MGEQVSAMEDFEREAAHEIEWLLERITELRRRAIRTAEEIERLQAALSWVENHDPQIIEAARTKFKLGRGAGQ
jgi:hypothetical protein